MRRTVAAAALACLPVFAVLVVGPGSVAPRAATAPTRLLRMPTVSANAVAFAYANNIWTVERAGGSARRLTSFQGEASNPRFFGRCR